MNSLDEEINTGLSLRNSLVGCTATKIKEKDDVQQHPIAFGVLKTNYKQQPTPIKIFFDSGATSSFLHEKFAKK